MFQTVVRVSNKADPGRAFEERFWVETGALYTFVPEDRLEAIGVRPEGRRDFVTADGRRETRPIGEAVLRIEGGEEARTCVVAFAPRGSLLLLGATALENFGLEADPANRTLRPIVAVTGGHLASG